MAPKPKRRATYDDLVKLPDHLVGELIDGELIASPRPASPHARATSAIGGQLFGPFDGPPGGGSAGGPGGWWIVDEPELHFGEDVLVPDLAGWRRERMPRMPNVPAFDLPPDWVVFSPSTERLDRARKMSIYARVKVAHLWLVNPLLQTLEVYALDGEGWRLLVTHAGSERVRARPFEAQELELSRWWLDPDPPG